MDCYDESLAGFFIITPYELIIVTVLFPLEASIPTAIMIYLLCKVIVIGPNISRLPHARE